jgi:AbrB family looped-hinge helix DNA binding protein
MDSIVTEQKAVKSTINQNGRIVIPAAIRQQMGLSAGDTLLLSVEGDVLKIESHRARIQRIQKEVARYCKPGPLASEELIVERREEAHREEAELERDRAERGPWVKVDQVA